MTRTRTRSTPEQGAGSPGVFPGLGDLLEEGELLLVALDVSGRVVHVNASVCELMGYTEEEFQGQDWFALAIPEDELADVEGAFRRSMAGTERHHVNAIRTRDGARRRIEWFNAPIRLGESEIDGTISIGRDVTGHDEGTLLSERERIAAQLRERILDGLMRIELRIDALRSATRDPAVAAGLAAVNEELDHAIGDIRDAVFDLTRAAATQD